MNHMPLLRVAVVGAGISGLVAARALLDAGVQVTVFESRSRVGGRLHGQQAGGSTTRLDLGATWYWPDEPRVNRLIAQLDIATHPHHLAGDALYHDPNGSRRVDGNPLDVPSGRFTDSAAAVAEAVYASFPDGTVRLDEAVTAIHLEDDQLRVGHTNSETLVDHVVLALPPALAVHRIDFNPDLPNDLERLATATPVWMGAIAKVVVTYDEPFWREAGLAGSAISHTGPLREIHDMSGPGGDPAAVFGFAPLTLGVEAPNTEAIERQLDELFGASAPRPTEIVITDWSTDPDTSPPDVRHHSAYQLFGHPSFSTPTHGRIHWCSTETATVAPGHIEGALQSADRAAMAILDTITATTTERESS